MINKLYILNTNPFIQDVPDEMSWLIFVKYLLYVISGLFLILYVSIVVISRQVYDHHLSNIIIIERTEVLESELSRNFITLKDHDMFYH